MLQPLRKGSPEDSQSGSQNRAETGNSPSRKQHDFVFLQHNWTHKTEQTSSRESACGYSCHRSRAETCSESSPCTERPRCTHAPADTPAANVRSVSLCTCGLRGVSLQSPSAGLQKGRGVAPLLGPAPQLQPPQSQNPAHVDSELPGSWCVHSLSLLLQAWGSREKQRGSDKGRSISGKLFQHLRVTHEWLLQKGNGGVSENQIKPAPL